MKKVLKALAGLALTALASTSSFEHRAHRSRRARQRGACPCFSFRSRSATSDTSRCGMAMGTMLDPQDRPPTQPRVPQRHRYAISCWLRADRGGGAAVLLARREAIPAAGVLATAVIERISTWQRSSRSRLAQLLSAPCGGRTPATARCRSRSVVRETDLVRAITWLGALGLGMRGRIAAPAQLRHGRLPIPALRGSATVLPGRLAKLWMSCATSPKEPLSYVRLARLRVGGVAADLDRRRFLPAG